MSLGRRVHGRALKGGGKLFHTQQLYRADAYKTKFCSHYPNNVETCDYKEYCSFAHSEDEILIELIHNLVFDDDFYIFSYKTVFCPFNLTEHDKALCVYAHNWQDFRRKPAYYSYQPIVSSHSLSRAPTGSSKGSWLTTPPTDARAPSAATCATAGRSWSTTA